VFRCDEYEAALDEAAIEFARTIPAHRVDLPTVVQSLAPPFASIPDSVLVHPRELAEFPLVDRDGR